MRRGTSNIVLPGRGAGGGAVQGGGCGESWPVAGSDAARNQVEPGRSNMGKLPKGSHRPRHPTLHASAETIRRWPCCCLRGRPPCPQLLPGLELLVSKFPVQPPPQGAES